VTAIRHTWRGAPASKTSAIGDINSAQETAMGDVIVVIGAGSIGQASPDG